MQAQIQGSVRSGQSKRAQARSGQKWQSNEQLLLVELVDIDRTDFANCVGFAMWQCMFRSLNACHMRHVAQISNQVMDQNTCLILIEIDNSGIDPTCQGK